jgi:hypothetical protein
MALSRSGLSLRPSFFIRKFFFTVSISPGWLLATVEASAL